MIIKENNNPTPAEKFEKAGYDAERKVAYYLKMAFGDNPNLLILNDLRVEFEDGITAQNGSSRNSSTRHHYHRKQKRSRKTTSSR